jgi:hypothetical protein
LIAVIDRRLFNYEKDLVNRELKDTPLGSSRFHQDYVCMSLTNIIGFNLEMDSVIRDLDEPVGTYNSSNRRRGELEDDDLLADFYRYVNRRCGEQEG